MSEVLYDPLAELLTLRAGGSIQSLTINGLSVSYVQYINPVKVNICILNPRQVNQEVLVAGNIYPNYGKAKKFTLSISKMLSTNNERALIFFNHEWQTSKKQVLNFIDSVLHLSSTTVYARKCVAKQITKEEACTFLDTEHIQGPSRATAITFGLYYNDTLVAVMTFGRHHRHQSVFNTPDTVVLDRYAVKAGYNIPGAASKLLSFACKSTAFSSYSKILSWADARISCGNLYDSLGFVKVNTLIPDYFYFCSESDSFCQGTSQIRGKQANKKSNLGIQGSSVTELEYTRDVLHQYRVYDCGKLVYIKTIK